MAGSSSEYRLRTEKGLSKKMILLEWKKYMESNVMMYQTKNKTGSILMVIAEIWPSEDWFVTSEDLKTKGWVAEKNIQNVKPVLVWNDETSLETLFKATHQNKMVLDARSLSLNRLMEVMPVLLNNSSASMCVCIHPSIKVEAMNASWKDQVNWRWHPSADLLFTEKLKAKKQEQQKHTPPAVKTLVL